MDNSEATQASIPIPINEVQHSSNALQNPGLKARSRLNPVSKSYDDSTIENLAHATNLDDPLYNVVTSNAFQGYDRMVPLSDLLKIPRKKLRKKILDSHCVSKEHLKRTFADFDGSFAVSCDLWTSFGFEDRYLSVICHWIVDDWTVENRVIGFKILYPFDFSHVAAKLIDVLNEFNLVDRVVSVSFDDCVTKEKCIEHLSDYFKPKVVEMFYHDRSFSNAVDVCAQLIVEKLAVVIDPIRDLLKMFRASPEKNREFRSLCRKKRLRYLSPRRIFLDFSINWRSVYENLETICSYKDVLTEIYNGCSDSEWCAVRLLVALLRKFDGVSSRFSLTYEALSHLAIKDGITVVRTLKIYEDDPCFSSAVRDVRSKWLELFPEFPTVYCVATILDPRVKVEGLRKLLVYYYESLGVSYNVDEKVAHSKNVLQQLHSQYSPPRDSDLESSDESLEFNVIRNVVKKRKVDEEENIGDLGGYLLVQFDTDEYEYNGSLEIRDWWANKEELLPILSKVAKDVLSIPVTTCIPLPRSCPGRRLLDWKRSMLLPKLINVSICRTDWLLADEGLQGEEDYQADLINVAYSSDSD